MDGNSFIPSLLSAVLNESAGPSNSIEITEVEENETESPSKVNPETQIVNKLLSGKLTYDDFTELYGDDSEEDEEEDNVEEEAEKQVQEEEKPAKKRRRVKSNALPVALQGLMGEANLRWAHGENDIAEKICFEIIRQVPFSAEPFQTLAQIYESDQPDKSLQFALIACHLNPNNPEEWMRFANISIEKQDYKQAYYCITKAINADPANISYHVLRMGLFPKLNDTRSYVRSSLRLLRNLTPEYPELILKYSLELAENFFKNELLDKASIAMEHLFKKCPNLVTVEHVNRMIDVLLGCKSYERVLEILVEFCSFSIEAEKQTYKRQDGTTEENLVVINYLIPSETPVDIHAKFLICLIHMKLENLTNQVMTEAGQFNVEQHGDLLFDIAEAFMQENHHLQAFTILDKLVLTEKFSMAAVWLRHAECLQACRKFPEAIESYKQVIVLAPQLADVRMTLSTLLREQGRVNEAIVALAQEVSVEELDSDVLVHRCKLLRQHFKFKEYIRDAFLLLSKHCVDESLVHELASIEAIEVPVAKSFRLYPSSDVFIKEPPQTKPEKGRSKKFEYSVQQDWKIFKDIINIAFLSKEFNLMQRITQAASQSKKFQKDYKKEVDFLNAIACIYTNDAFNGYTILRYMLLNDVQNAKLWNCFNGLLQTPEDTRIIRFVMRLLAKFSLNKCLHVIHANNSLIAGTYKYALNKYIETYKSQQTPLLAFLIGITMFQMACQKSTAKKHSLVVQGYAFMTQYQKLRGKDCQHEVYYNFGRALHQLGLFSLAIHYYKKVLRYDSKLLRMKFKNTVDLKREAAFNLSLCYKASGNRNLAIMHLRKYIVV